MKKTSLDGEWQLRIIGTDEYKKAAVPGCLQADLGMIDLFCGLDEHKYYGIEDNDCEYRKSFDYDGSGKSVQLVFEGIDTISDIYLNDIHIGSTKNMFTEHCFDVSSAIKKGENILSVMIYSSKKYAETEMEKDSIKLNATCDFTRPYIRKAQYSFGWDWGPRVVHTGIWKSIYLKETDKGEIKDLYIYTKEIKESFAVVCISGGYSGEAAYALVALEINGWKKEIELPVKDNLFSGEIIIENPRLWYPRGYGSQPLYDVRVKAGDEEEALKFGIRTVEIEKIRQEDNTESFIFVINGKRIFAKGACTIPLHTLVSLAKNKDYERLIELAADVNMNMLRIWGGGIYEKDVFYKKCDELGILVWQDFMYACAEYPDHNAEFCDLAREETEKAVKRLRNYTCIALWCGNNENNWGMRDWWGRKGEPEHLGNYIYKTIIPETLEKLDLSRPYHISSPYGGETPNSQSEGDCHFWEVWSGYKPIEQYLSNTGKFISEYGFQAMPCLQTVYEYTPESERKIFSKTTINHNKQISGTERIMRYMLSVAGFPKDFKSYVMLSQYVQAEAIKLATEHWRSRKYLTAGTLYWQLNDCYPVASWSCLDYKNRKKALYYYTKKFFAQKLMTLSHCNEGVRLRIVNDTDEKIEQEVKILAYKTNGEQTASRKISVYASADGVFETVIPYCELMENYIEALEPVGFNIGTVVVDKYNKNLESTVFYAQAEGFDDAYLLGKNLREMKLEKPKINTVIENNAIKLTIDRPCIGLFLLTEGDLSDNCITPFPNKEIVISSNADCKKIELISVYDMTKEI